MIVARRHPYYPDDDSEDYLEGEFEPLDPRARHQQSIRYQQSLRYQAAQARQRHSQRSRIHRPHPSQSPIPRSAAYGNPALSARHQLPPPPPLNIRPAGEVRPSKLLAIVRRPDSIAAQQYRLLKYKLKESDDPRVIGITSPRPQEGKTTVAANLALALAEGRRERVMLLDLNMRQPAMSKMFGINFGAGFAEQLRYKHKNPTGNWDVLELGTRLHMIAGGRPIENPAPLLNTEELTQLLYDLPVYYEYVVVDLPAVLVAADVKIVQEFLDGLVLVCKAGVTTKSNVNAAVNQLGLSKLYGVMILNIESRYIPK